jgi:hypothetical protein
MRLRSIPQSVSNRLAPYRASFSRGPAQHFNIWCWLLVTIIIASSGQVKTLTRYMPSRLAYWTTLRMIRAKVWNEQALLDLMVADILYSLPPPKDGVLHLIFDTTRKEKTGEKQPLAFTTKMGKFEPYVFGHSVLLLIAQWGGFRIPLAVRVLDPKIRGHQNLLTREMLQKFKPPLWSRQVIIEADAGFAAKKTLHLIAELGYFYVFALPRTWKTVSGKHLSNIARHTPKHLYHRVASYKPDGRRRDYWIFRSQEKLSTLGDVTLVLSKRRFNDPPHKIKLLVTNLKDASTCDILSHFARRWMIEVTFREIKSGLHLGQMQVTKEERRIQRSVVLPVMAYLLLLRLYGSELEPGQSASLFALKQRFIEEAYQEQFDRTESRFKKKLEQLKRAA